MNNKLHDVFKPVKKGDRVRSVNLFREVISVFFERDERGLKTTYVKLAHPSAVTNLVVGWKVGVERILFHDYSVAALLTPLSTGRKVYLEPWVSNSSENSKTLNINMESLVFTVEGLGHYSLDKITDVTSGGYDLFGPEVKGRWNNRGEHTTGESWETASKNQFRYCDTQVAGFYPPVEKAVTK